MRQPGIEIPCVRVSKSVTELNEGVSENSDSCKTFFRSSMVTKTVAFQSVWEDREGDRSNSDVTASNSNPTDRTLRREMAVGTLCDG